MNELKSIVQTIVGLLLTAVLLLCTATIVFINKDQVNHYLASKKADRRDRDNRTSRLDLVDYKEYFATIGGVAKVDNYEFSENLVLLGKHLYFDKRLSKEGNNSCNSCHNLNTYGVDNKPFSAGDLGDLRGRNSPTVLNATLHFLQFWDGRAPDVEAQAGSPILNPVEMNIPSKAFLVDRLKGIAGYVDLFNTVYSQSLTGMYSKL